MVLPSSFYWADFHLIHVSAIFSPFVGVSSSQLMSLSRLHTLQNKMVLEWIDSSKRDIVIQQSFVH